MTFRSVLALSVVMFAFMDPVAAQPAAPHATAKQKARAAAASWLALVDEDAFGESWDRAAALLQEKIERADWIRKAERLRDSVEPLSTRTLTRTQYRNVLRRAPNAGPFVVLKYRSTHNADRFEELVLTVQQDTTWKVAGYQVTPLRDPVSTSARSSSSP